MKAYVLVVTNNPISEFGFKTLSETSIRVQNEFKLERFEAINPNIVYDVLDTLGLKWNYPWEGSIFDEQIKLIKTAYNTKVKENRISCAIGHYLLWDMCTKLNEPILILEHDAQFIQKLNIDIPDEYDIIGINDPRGATRKSQVFHNIVQTSTTEFLPVPIIDNLQIPQGLAGNSAYILKPKGAEKLIELVYLHGLWPNDAIMCQQLIPNMGVTRKYYTKTQGLQSTTST